MLAGSNEQLSADTCFRKGTVARTEQPTHSGLCLGAATVSENSGSDSGWLRGWRLCDASFWVVVRSTVHLELGVGADPITVPRRRPENRALSGIPDAVRPSTASSAVSLRNSHVCSVYYINFDPDQNRLGCLRSAAPSFDGTVVVAGTLCSDT